MSLPFNAKKNGSEALLPLNGGGGNQRITPSEMSAAWKSYREDKIHFDGRVSRQSWWCGLFCSCLLLLSIILIPILLLIVVKNMAQSTVDQSDLQINSFKLNVQGGPSASLLQLQDSPSPFVLMASQDVTLSNTGGFSATIKPARMKVVDDATGLAVATIEMPQIDVKANEGAQFSFTNSLEVTDVDGFKAMNRRLFGGEDVVWRMVGDLTLRTFGLDYDLTMDKRVTVPASRIENLQAIDVELLSTSFDAHQNMSTLFASAKQSFTARGLVEMPSLGFASFGLTMKLENYATPVTFGTIEIEDFNLRIGSNIEAVSTKIFAFVDSQGCDDKTTCSPKANWANCSTTCLQNAAVSEFVGKYASGDTQHLDVHGPLEDSRTPTWLQGLVGCSPVELGSSVWCTVQKVEIPGQRKTLVQSTFISRETLTQNQELAPGFAIPAPFTTVMTRNPEMVAMTQSNVEFKIQLDGDSPIGFFKYRLMDGSYQTCDVSPVTNRSYGFDFPSVLRVPESPVVAPLTTESFATPVSVIAVLEEAAKQVVVGNAMDWAMKAVLGILGTPSPFFDGVNFLEQCKELNTIVLEVVMKKITPAEALALLPTLINYPGCFSVLPDVIKPLVGCNNTEFEKLRSISSFILPHELPEPNSTVCFPACKLTTDKIMEVYLEYSESGTLPPSAIVGLLDSCVVETTTPSSGLLPFLLNVVAKGTKSAPDVNAVNANCVANQPLATLCRLKHRVQKTASPNSPLAKGGYTANVANSVPVSIEGTFSLKLGESFLLHEVAYHQEGLPLVFDTNLLNSAEIWSWFDETGLWNPTIWDNLLDSEVIKIVLAQAVGVDASAIGPLWKSMQETGALKRLLQAVLTDTMGTPNKAGLMCGELGDSSGSFIQIGEQPSQSSPKTSLLEAPTTANAAMLSISASESTRSSKMRRRSRRKVVAESSTADGAGCISAKVWAFPNASKPDFPEQSVPSVARKANVGIAISGGGARSYSLAWGYLRYFSEKGLLDNVKYISGDSGGAWAASVFSFWASKNNAGVADECAFLGSRTDPKFLSAASLGQINEWEMGAAATRPFLGDLLSGVANDGLPLDQVWESAVRNAYYTPYGMGEEDQLYTLDSQTEADIKSRNPSLADRTFLKLRDERPYLIMTTTLVAPTDGVFVDPTKTSNTFEYDFTPLYSGVPAPATNVVFNKVDVKGASPSTVKAQIGGFVETFVAGTAPVSSNSSCFAMPSKGERQIASLATAGAFSSSWGVANLGFLFPPTSNQTGTAAILNAVLDLLKPTENGKDMVDSMDSLSVSSESVLTSTTAYFADGGLNDGSAIISQLVRNVDTIISLLSCDGPSAEAAGTPCALKKNDPSQILPQIAMLFGLGCEKEPGQGNEWGKSLCEQSHVFSNAKGEYAALVTEMQGLVHENGTAPIVAQKLELVANEHHALPAPGTEVSITWAYLAWVPSFAEEVEDKVVRDWLQDGATNGTGPLAHFPNYATTFANCDLAKMSKALSSQSMAALTKFFEEEPACDASAYTNSQVNALADYTSWSAALYHDHWVEVFEASASAKTCPRTSTPQKGGTSCMATVVQQVTPLYAQRFEITEGVSCKV